MVDLPRRGDAIWITLELQAGREQKGRRPALVISATAYNRQVGLVIACLITNQVKGYPFEVPIPPNLQVTGVILADQVRNLDWRARDAEYICDMPGDVVEDVLEKINRLVDPV